MHLAALAVALALASPPARAEATELDPAAAADSASAAAAGLSMPEPSPPVVRAREREAAGPSRFGLLLDAGFPEGASVSAVFRPVPSVRLWAGPAWNYVGYGLQGGIAAVPWHWALTPVVSAEVGRYFGADVSFITSDGQGVPDDLKPLLEDMTYTYAAAHVGVEIGSQSGLAFSVRAGLAYVSLETRGTVTVTDSGSQTVARLSDPRVRGTIPSVKLGVNVWF